MLCFGQIETTLSKSFSVEKNTSLDLVGNINTSYFLLLRGQRMDQLVKFNRELVMEDVYSFNQPENEYTILNFVKVKDSIFSLAYMSSPNVSSCCLWPEAARSIAGALRPDEL